MIIGRKREQELLEKAYRSKEAEFIAVYGRRRVGKTFLIREFFSARDGDFFHVTGLKKGSLKTQLTKFAEAISLTFLNKAPLAAPKTWHQAFDILQEQLLERDKNKKVIIFLDELPWLATKRSGLLQELDYYWNRYWSAMPHIVLVVCGSSASWLIKKIIQNKGGLYNRITCQIKLLPFNLAETDEFLKNRDIRLNQRHVLMLYMALGGIPYYLKYVKQGLSAEQNIQQIIFDENAPLKDEFAGLFDSLFENAHIYVELVHIISQKREGIGKEVLGSMAHLAKKGGRLSERLADLTAAGFITEYIPWGRVRGEYYKLTDEFCLFYLYWVGPQKGKIFAPDYWIHQSERPTYFAWSGYAFEAVCMKHINQILSALHIRTGCTIGTWRFIPQKKVIDDGAQIDLVIDRDDNSLNLCEIKYTEQPYAIDKNCAAKLRRVVELFKRKTGTNKQIFITLVTANGMKETLYSEDMIDGVVILADLFASIH